MTLPKENINRHIQEMVHYLKQDKLISEETSSLIASYLKNNECYKFISCRAGSIPRGDQEAFIDKFAKALSVMVDIAVSLANKPFGDPYREFITMLSAIMATCHLYQENGPVVAKIEITYKFLSYLIGTGVKDKKGVLLSYVEGE